MLTEEPSLTIFFTDLISWISSLVLVNFKSSKTNYFEKPWSQELPTLYY